MSSLYMWMMIKFFGLSMFFLLMGFVFKVNCLIYLFDFNLISWGGVDLSYEIMFDWISSLFMGVVFLISSSVFIFSKGYMKGDVWGVRFILLMIMFVYSMMLSVVSGGLLSSMLGWDGLGVISYILVIYYQSSNSYKSGMITISTNRIGDIMILVSISLSLSLGYWSFFVMKIDLLLVMIFLVLAACTKSAQIPFSAWLPEASAAPTPVSSLVHSSTLVTAGVFLLVRFKDIFEEEFVSSLLLYSSLMTMLVAGVCALMESDGKKVVASSTLSQLGLMMFSLSMGMWMITYFHMIMHAFFKALMFMCMGSILYGEGGCQDIRFMSGKFKNSYIINQGFLISVLCLSGFPFFCAFFSKDLLLMSYFMMSKGSVECMVFFFGFGLSVIYGSRLFMVSMIDVGEEKVYGSFSENMYMNMGIFVSIVVSLLSGSLYSWMEIEFNEIMLCFSELLLSFMILIVGMIFIGGLMSFYLLKVEYFSKKSKFMSSSWNFSLLSGKSGEVMMVMNNMFSMEENDYLWVEEFGGNKYSFWLLMMVKVYYKKIKELLLLMFFMVFLVGLLV